MSRQLGDSAGLRQTVGQRLDHDHVADVAFQEGSEGLPPDQRLAVADAGPGLLSGGEESVRVEALGLQPVEVERLERPSELQDPAHPVLLPDVKENAHVRPAPLPQRTRILAADGSVIAQFYYENRVSVPLTEVAPVMRQAIVAIEDARFYQHSGVDLKGVVRALVVVDQRQPAVERSDRLDSERLRIQGTIAREVAPVERDPVAIEATDQVVDWHAKPLPLDVVERQVERGDDLHPLGDSGSA